MSYLTRSDNLPPRTNTQEGQERRIGIEVELAGLTPDTLAKCVQKHFGGEVSYQTRTEYLVKDTDYGDFQLELDFALFKEIAEERRQDATASEFGDAVFDVVTSAAELLVPWEIVTPPMPISSIDRFADLSKELRDHGALGTRHGLHLAFGLHLNPELPSLEVADILAYLRAFFCLYEWICEEEKIDLTRKLSRYAKHFEKDYILSVLDLDYRPDLGRMIDDYLEANPTRNRSLDMLPLFCHLDEDKVRKAVHDERVKPRPTFHYRLPNCDIDNPEWSIETPWKLWLAVEYLADNEVLLNELCEAYYKELKSPTHIFFSDWPAYIDKRLAEF